MRFERVRPIEWSILIYIQITLIFILVNWKIVFQPIGHVAIRIIIFSIIIVFVQLTKRQFNSIINAFRIFSPLLILGYFYSETDYLNNLVFTENLDPIFVNIEQQLLGVQWSEKFSQVLPSNFFAEIMYLGYFSYYLLIIGLPLLIYFKFGRQIAEKAIFIVINSFLIYYILFIVFPVIGPQFHFQNSTQTLPQGFVFGWLIRTIQHYGEAPTAAFPSSHVSICLMLVWICFKHLKKMLIVVLPIAILLIFSTVYIKAHYVIDVLAAFVVTPVIYAISNKLFCYLTLKPAQHDCIDT